MPVADEWSDAKALGTLKFPVKADGTFELTNIPRIKWSVSALAPGMKPWFGAYDGRSNRSLEGLQAELEPGVTIRGQILRTDGTPLPKATLSWMRPFASYSEEAMSSWKDRVPVTVDPKGRFELDNLSAGIYRLMVVAPDGVVKTRDVTVNAPGVLQADFRLRRASDPQVSAFVP